MSENPEASEWASARGEKWRAQHVGMEAMLAPINEPLISALNLDAPYRIADVGCGGGATTLEIARRAPPGSVVHGFDISPALIELARSRKSSNESAIEFELADMGSANPPAASYQRLVSRFGIMFFDDPLAAFTNLARWLSPRGRFAFATWGPPAQNPWISKVREVVAEIIDLPAPDTEAPGAFRYADADKFLKLLDSAGYSEVNVEDWRGLLSIGGGLPASEAASFAIAAFSSFGELLAQAGNDAVDKARQSLTERFAEYEEDGVVRLNACVHIFTGTRLRG